MAAGMVRSFYVSLPGPCRALVWLTDLCHAANLRQRRPLRWLVKSVAGRSGLRPDFPKTRYDFGLVSPSMTRTKAALIAGSESA
jgi:hypothetical protein